MSTLAATLAAFGPPDPAVEQLRGRLKAIALEIQGAATNVVRYAEGKKSSTKGNRLDAIIGRETARLAALGAEARRAYEAIRAAAEVGS